MVKYVLYGHDGSANHGCEAIVRSTISLLNSDKDHIFLVSAKPDEDTTYNISDICTISERGKKVKSIKRNRDFFRAYYELKIRHDFKPMDYLAEAQALGVNHNDVALAIGGDSYCYSNSMREKLFYQHCVFKSMGMKTVLWGCSFEEELLNDALIAEDIRSFDLITARESISYNALKKANPNTLLVSDTAFLLSEKQLPMPEGFEGKDIVGINSSPLIERREPCTGIVRKNIEKLIESILAETEYKILLIPHVVWHTNDDRAVLRELFEMFSGSGRVAMIEDHNCEELKGYISRCRFFVGARTHATIAAYSNCIPTLVLGYSTKSRGIATDLFGNYENYVLPIQSLVNETDLIDKWHWLQENEDACQRRLTEVLPEYIDQVYKGLNAVKSL